MANWRKTVNYGMKKDSKGQVTAWYVRINGEEISVSEELYTMYSSMDRKDRYMRMEEKRNKVASLEQMAEDKVLEDYADLPTVPSAEDIIIAQEEQAEWDELKRKILPALLSLSEEDRNLILALFYDNKSVRGYAKEIHKDHKAVSRRRDRILRQLKKFFEEN